LKALRKLLPASLILLFSAIAFLVMGYHPGAEDDAVYLAAVKYNLNHALFPHDADFFRVQLQATLFDKLMAGFVYFTGLSVPWAELLWQLISIVLIVWSVKAVATRLFKERSAQWASVALVTALFTLPVSGTALFLVDQYLHPRNLATAAILAAVTLILDRKYWRAVPILMVAFVLHPIMAALGISFCVFLTLAMLGEEGRLALPRWAGATAFVPLGWVFEPPSDPWRQALKTRTYYFLYHWEWYEWLGAIGPLVILYLVYRWSRKAGHSNLTRLSLALVCYGIFQQIVAMVMLWPASFIRLYPLQPMRFLQLIYLFMALVLGGLLGRALLRKSIWRWAVYLIVIYGGMYLGQRNLFAGNYHLELPGRAPANPWLQSFEWIRQNTPVDAYFTMDPRYMKAPGEDYHNFRPLAERSMLKDTIKDSAVVTQVPSLAATWQRESAAQQGYSHFQLADFERLKRDFGADWAIVSLPAPAGLDCKWHNNALAVCRIP
jgi:hypothetical protein